MNSLYSSDFEMFLGACVEMEISLEMPRCTKQETSIVRLAPWPIFEEKQEIKFANLAQSHSDFD